MLEVKGVDGVLRIDIKKDELENFLEWEYLKTNWHNCIFRAERAHLPASKMLFKTSSYTG